MKECDRVGILFGPYLYDNVTPAERAAVESHIETCERCAADLRSRSEVLEKLRSHAQPGEMPQRAQDDFAWNVYRKIASESLRHKKRQVFLRRFVLQPSLAGVALAAGIAVAVLQFFPGDATVNEPAPLSARADEIQRKTLRAYLDKEEFFKRQGTTYESERSYAAIDRVSGIEPIASDTDPLLKNRSLSYSWQLLENANLFNYSLGDTKRALEMYQRLFDYYPNTDAAMQAREESRAILGIQRESAGSEKISDKGI